MSWENIADRVLRTTIQVFKTAGTYTRLADPTHPISIDGVFDRPNQDIDPQTGAVVQSVQISFGIRLADLPVAPDAGDTIMIGSQNYRILASNEDGQGGADLILGEL